MIEIALRNPRNLDLAPVTVEVLADSGSLHLCIPQHVQNVSRRPGIFFPEPRKAFRELGKLSRRRFYT